jgi:plastocyanin
MRRTNLIVLALAAVLVAVVALAGCSSTPKVTTSGTSSTSSQASDFDVDITSSGYVPQTNAVPVGYTVVWINEDKVAHTVTSTTFDSGKIQPGKQFQFTFNNEGSFDYHDTIFPAHTGTILVSRSAPVPATGTSAPKTTTGQSVNITSTGFSTPYINLQTGNSVTWTNGDSSVHSVVGQGFSSGDLQPGQQYTHLFTAAGNYAFHDGHNASATGSVAVANAP